LPATDKTFDLTPDPGGRVWIGDRKMRIRDLSRGDKIGIYLSVDKFFAKKVDEIALAVPDAAADTHTIVSVTPAAALPTKHLGAILSAVAIENPVGRSTHSMKRADLVAGGVAQIGQIELAERAFTNTGRILTSDTAVGQTGSMPCVGHLRTLGLKTDGTAVSLAGRLTINWLGDCEYAGTYHVKTTTVVVDRPRFVAHRTQDRIIKILRLFDVVSTNHYVTEHFFSLGCC
jgi:hypothetical protein